VNGLLITDYGLLDLEFFVDEKKKAALRIGTYVFIALFVLTIGEYIVSQTIDSTVLLLIIALLKAAPIVYFFMHVSRLWREENH
jgi:cytochrome c oxidase subunit 4